MQALQQRLDAVQPLLVERRQRGRERGDPRVDRLQAGEFAQVGFEARHAQVDQQVADQQRDEEQAELPGFHQVFFDQVGLP